ncbi:YitT family protein [Pasteuria penetrans]|uniref:YitT family protein n=1 Tax=Pasteuria penetrans TaxID=86005 RepID=UPI000FBED144|nr:YitT family protein [Pasteuria penetrans]
MRQVIQITYVRDLIGIMIGTMAMALGIHAFSIPSNLAEGGFAGLGLLIHYRTGWPLSYLLFLLNILPLGLGYKILGKKSFLYSVFGIICMAFSLEIISYLGDNPFGLQDSPVLSSLHAGVLIGIGCGLVFQAGGTTGGWDIIAQIIHRRTRLSLGKVILLWDILILLISAYTLTLERAMYTLIEMVIVARVIDFILGGGLQPCRTATIISRSAPLLQHELIEKMNLGATILSGKGAYTGNPQEVLYTVLFEHELAKLYRLVTSLDPESLIIVHRAHMVEGGGSSKYLKKISLPHLFE